MALFVEILWVVFGVAYIIYKGLQEERGVFGPAVLFLGIVFGPAVLICIACAAMDIEVEGWIAVLTSLSPLIGLAFIFLYKPDTKKIEEKERERSEKLYDTVLSFLKTCDPDVKREVLDHYFNDPCAPWNKGNNISPIICYQWVSREATKGINQCKGKRIDELLGMPLDKIPIDKTIKPGNALFKREELARLYILRSYGLQYYDLRFAKGVTPITDEEQRSFFIFVDNYKREHTKETPQ